MKKIIFFLIIFISQFFLAFKINSSEIEIYKKIDLFGEVLEKINKEYVDEINQFFCKYLFLMNELLE